MPLYLVNWTDMSFALIRARDEHDLFWKVDQHGNPYEVSYRIYRSPLFLRLELDAELKAKFGEGNFFPVDLEVKDDENVRDYPRFKVHPENVEAADEMWFKITEIAFPALSRYYKRVYSDDEDPTCEDLRKALLEDMQRMPEPTFEMKKDWYE